MATTYCQKSDCLSFTAGLVVTDDSAFDELINRCERDVDRLLNVDYRNIGAAGLKVPSPPGKLTAKQAEGLKRATCAQVEHRLTVGELSLRRVAHKRVKGPDFEVEEVVGGDQRLGSKVYDELSAAGLLRYSVATL